MEESKGQRVRDSLLFVIALCLVLIVIRLYSGDLISEAHAARVTTPILLYACGTNEGCSEDRHWYPVRIEGERSSQSDPA